MSDFPKHVVIPKDTIPDRADKVLAEFFEGELSRSVLARLIKNGSLLVQGKPIRPSTLLNPGDEVDIFPPRQEKPPVTRTTTQCLSILFEDDDIVVVNKPPGLVVHPGAGRSSGTLMDALVEARPEMIGVGDAGRWGIVHRLDRDTSGAMVVAKSALAYKSLSAKFKTHSIHREYLALVRGSPGDDEGFIDTPLGRHPRDRKRMSTTTSKPRAAQTRWKVRMRLGQLTLLEVTPQTGRTHQIRVHLASIGLPVAGDPMYGRLRKKTGNEKLPVNRVLKVLKRQALHAAVLGFQHPITSHYLEFTAPIPPDMDEAIKLLQEK